MVCDDMMRFIGAQPSGAYDLVVCSHALYHVPRNRWFDFLANSLRAVDADGRMILVARSRTGEWWQLFDRPAEALRDLRKPTYIFAEDIEEAIAEFGFEFERSTAQYEINLESEAEVLRVAEFLYRVPPGTLKQRAEVGRRILERAESSRRGTGYEIRFDDAVMSLRPGRGGES